MANKQILAALQIESNEVRLVVGEIFNTRLNTLKKECIPGKGMDGIRIADPKAVAKAVKEAVSNVESHFGVAIESVLLAIPAYRFKKETRSFSKVIDSVDRRITADDNRDIYQKALAVNVVTAGGKHNPLYCPWRVRASRLWWRLLPVRRWILAIYRRTWLKIVA